MMTNPIIEYHNIEMNLHERQFVFNGDRYVFYRGTVKQIFDDKTMDVCTYKISQKTDTFESIIEFSDNNIFPKCLILNLIMRPEGQEFENCIILI